MHLDGIRHELRRNSDFAYVGDYSCYRELLRCVEHSPIMSVPSNHQKHCGALNVGMPFPTTKSTGEASFSLAVLSQCSERV